MNWLIQFCFVLLTGIVVGLLLHVIKSPITASSVIGGICYFCGRMSVLFGGAR